MESDIKFIFNNKTDVHNNKILQDIINELEDIDNKLNGNEKKSFFNLIKNIIYIIKEEITNNKKNKKLISDDDNDSRVGLSEDRPDNLFRSKKIWKFLIIIILCLIILLIILIIICKYKCSNNRECQKQNNCIYSLDSASQAINSSEEFDLNSQIVHSSIRTPNSDLQDINLTNKYNSIETHSLNNNNSSNEFDLSKSNKEISIISIIHDSSISSTSQNSNT